MTKNRAQLESDLMAAKRELDEALEDLLKRGGDRYRACGAAIKVSALSHALANLVED